MYVDNFVSKMSSKLGFCVGFTNIDNQTKDYNMFMNYAVHFHSALFGYRPELST